MRPVNNVLLLVSLSSLLLHRAAALCVPRNTIRTLIDNVPKADSATKPQFPIVQPSIDPTTTEPENVGTKLSDKAIAKPQLAPEPSVDSIAEQPSVNPVAEPPLTDKKSSDDFTTEPLIPVKQPSVDSILGYAAKSLCARTVYPELCESTVQATGTIDAKALLLNSIDAATAKTKSAKEMAIKFSTDPKLETMVQNFVGGCPTHYDDALDCLSTALKAIAEHDRPTAESNLNAFITNVNTCEDDFEDMAAASPMLTYDSELSKMGSNILEFFNLLKQ